MGSDQYNLTTRFFFRKLLYFGTTICIFHVLKSSQQNKVQSHINDSVFQFNFLTSFWNYFCLQNSPSWCDLSVLTNMYHTSFITDKLGLKKKVMAAIWTHRNGNEKLSLNGTTYSTLVVSTLKNRKRWLPFRMYLL